ncbi:MAG: 50S ribosomal protein L20, partial [Gemmatimonadetes bacterium]|nr:50S ribosomal protein L20 [Gemmatimonadota bacterium]
MPRVNHAVATKKRKKKVLKQSKGYWGARSRLFRTAREAVDRAQAYAYRDRRQRKRDFRRLWIIRINAAARRDGMSYSQLDHGLAQACVTINR